MPGPSPGTRKKTEDKMESLPSPCFHSMVRGMESLHRETKGAIGQEVVPAVKKKGARVVGCLFR